MRARRSGGQGPLTGLHAEPPPAPEWFTHAAAQQPESRFVSEGGPRIHYLRWGDRRKPGLLFVHGNAAHAHWWSFIAPFFSADHNVVAMDLSGMGDSDWRTPHGEDGGYSMPLFAQEQIAVCADAGMFDAQTPPVIVAHSFGGLVATQTGADYGDRLQGIVILDTPINPRVRKSEEIRLSRHNVYPDMASALARFQLMPPQPVENLFLVDWVARHSLKPARMADGRPGLTWKFDPAIWRHFLIADTAALLKATSCRIAIMYGEKSAVMNRQAVEFATSVLGPKTRIEPIAGAHHHVMLDRPLELVACLRAILADWSAPTPN